MQEPVVLLCSGKVYDKKSIEDFFASNRTVAANTLPSTETQNYLEHFKTVQKKLSECTSSRSKIILISKRRHTNALGISTNPGHSRYSLLPNSSLTTQNINDTLSFTLGEP